MERYRALVARADGEEIASSVEELETAPLQEGYVRIRVAYSSVNFKDALAVTPRGNVVKQYPHVPGIDLAGSVTATRDARFREGDTVLVTGFGLGVSAPGGYAEIAQVPADWVVPLPGGMTAREAMAYGTAGFTAALSVLRLEEAGLAPGGQGPVLVTGATGGVGSVAVSMLAGLGYEVAASSRKADAEAQALLRRLGASELLAPDALRMPEGKAIVRERWAGVVDPVGGVALRDVLGSVRYGGGVALSGFTGGADFAANVYPFILRGVKLLGIDSVLCPMPERLRAWERMAGDLKPAGLLDAIASETTLEALPEALRAILRGEMRGRVVVAL
ncbi:acryloyl-CoA reductase [Cohnella sp. JJ-181]|uniref:acrylyl-CoA reductase family protein n=1 Tax=Cohnella rhizoplanae TaxID=2974897 RepID=UPI0022FF7CE6|nr:acryloyl-CoA reductase [Cohnella sp. JJ-181]CAI6065851.1 Putative quinone oxidoreductase YhfP [Cohnella sp. JJ-181]